jgi:hypothetical protein
MRGKKREKKERRKQSFRKSKHAKIKEGKTIKGELREPRKIEAEKKLIDCMMSQENKNKKGKREKVIVKKK